MYYNNTLVLINESPYLLNKQIFNIIKIILIIFQEDNNVI